MKTDNINMYKDKYKKKYQTKHKFEYTTMCLYAVNMIIQFTYESNQTNDLQILRIQITHVTVFITSGTDYTCPVST